ncbi:MAG TPA: toprim domain-containing protein [Sorangium sp.]|nr:toprim domain-containing protein [Sorangium sp.]
MISPETVAAVRERADITVVIGENVRLQKRGRSHLGLCPFHKEKTPSFSVNQERGLFYCFGCHESGSVIDYVMRLEGYTFPEAIRALAERFSIEVVETGSAQEHQRAQRRRRDRDELYAVNNLAAVYFEQQLAAGGHPLAELAHAELARRGLALGQNEVCDEALRAFRIGYAPYGWDGFTNYLRAQGQSPKLAHKLGLITARQHGDGYYDAFRHRLMFAVMDKAGRVVAFSGRALEEPAATRLQQLGIEPMYRPRPGEEQRPAPKYVNSAESPIYVKGETVFGLYQARLALRREQQSVLVEGNFDVLALHARGVHNVVAPLGTAFTSAQANLLKRYAPEVVVLFDADRAGRKAAAALRAPAREAGLRVRVGKLPDGADPDDFARQHGVAALRAVLKNASGMLEYLIDETLGGDAVWDGSREQTLARIKQVVGFLAEERDPSLRQMAKTYADQVASKLVIGGHAPSDLRALERMVARALAQPTNARERVPDVVRLGPKARSPVDEDAIDRAVLGALLDFPELLGEAVVQEAVGYLSGEVALGLAALVQMWDAKKPLESGQLLDLMPQAIHSFAVGRLASPKFIDLEAARSELLKNTSKIRLGALRGDKHAVAQELARAQGMGDVDAEDDLLRQLTRVAQEKRRLRRND